MTFDFANPTRVVFGPGTLREAGRLVRPFGSSALVVTGRNPARAARLLETLAGEGISPTTLPIAGEPTVSDIQTGVDAGREAGCDVVIGFGGGSAIDAAKAIAAMLTNPGDLLDYLEVIGKAQPLTHSPLPFIAIPTTAGTGSEMTRNAVIGSPEHRVKVSLRSPLMLAKVAIVDPELALQLPPDITASTGMDALTQCIEAFVSCRANPLTDAFCLEGIRRAARSLRRACETGNDLEARSDMALASLYSGIALANAGLGAVHGFAGPLGGMFPAPHGALCATLLAPVMRANVAALCQRAAASHTLERFAEIARLLTDQADASIEEGIQWVTNLTKTLCIPGLNHWGVGLADLQTIAGKARAASSMKGNPIALTQEELAGVLAAAM
jgi:alcohol dehydrogenase class IV